MAVAGHPRILLRGIDRAELASILGALGDVTTPVDWHDTTTTAQSVQDTDISNVNFTIR